MSGLGCAIPTSWRTGVSPAPGCGPPEVAPDQPPELQDLAVDLDPHVEELSDSVIGESELAELEGVQQLTPAEVEALSNPLPERSGELPVDEDPALARALTTSVVKALAADLDLQESKARLCDSSARALAAELELADSEAALTRSVKAKGLAAELERTDARRGL